MPRPASPGATFAGHETLGCANRRARFPGFGHSSRAPCPATGVRTSRSWMSRPKRLGDRRFQATITSSSHPPHSRSRSVRHLGPWRFDPPRELRRLGRFEGPPSPCRGTAGPALDAVERSMRSASTLHDRATPPTSRRAPKTARPSMARRTSLPDLSIELGVRARDRSLACAVERPFVRHGGRTIASSFMRVAGAFALCQPSPRRTLRFGLPRRAACLREASCTDPESLLARERRRFDGRLSSSAQVSNDWRTIRESCVDRGAVRFPSPRREGMPPPRGAFHRRFALGPSPFDEAPIAKGIRMSGLSRASRLADRIRNTSVHGCPRPRRASMRSSGSANPGS